MRATERVVALTNLSHDRAATRYIHRRRLDRAREVIVAASRYPVSRASAATCLGRALAGIAGRNVGHRSLYLAARKLGQMTGDQAVPRNIRDQSLFCNHRHSGKAATRGGCHGGAANDAAA